MATAKNTERQLRPEQLWDHVVPLIVYATAYPSSCSVRTRRSLTNWFSIKPEVRKG